MAIAPSRAVVVSPSPQKIGVFLQCVENLVPVWVGPYCVVVSEIRNLELLSVHPLLGQ